MGGPGRGSCANPDPASTLMLARTLALLPPHLRAPPEGLAWWWVREVRGLQGRGAHLAAAPSEQRGARGGEGSVACSEPAGLGTVVSCPCARTWYRPGGCAARSTLALLPFHRRGRRGTGGHRGRGSWWGGAGVWAPVAWPVWALHRSLLPPRSGPRRGQRGCREGRGQGGPCMTPVPPATPGLEPGR